jgi:uncharacterized membrane protein YdbT with pleckstrin-like domain
MALRLHPGEQILFEGHPSWRAILAFYLKGFLITLVICLIAGLVGAGAGFVILLAIIGVAVTVLVGFIKRVATTYTITDRRLNIKRGIISREVQETRLERVQNVNFSQGVFQRMLQVGDVDFDTAAGDDYNFIFFGVDDPADVVHTVDRATGLAGPLGEPQAHPPAQAHPTQPQ